MGILVAKKYKTQMFLNFADHTYVECGTGAKAWSCWGGKSGGTAFNQGIGSTKRANAIAKPNERAGITTYLIDGVCHQAANRILFPSGIQVAGARGYGLSLQLFGIYGRSTFDFHPHVSGDLVACAQPNNLSEHQQIKRAIDIKLIESARRFNMTGLRRFGRAQQFHRSQNLKSYHALIQILFADKLSLKRQEGLMQAKFDAETRLFILEKELKTEQIGAVEFVKEFNKMTEVFQDDSANVLTSKQYETAFGNDVDKRIILADPQALNDAFGPGTSEQVYGDSPKNTISP
ncbi:hypothetical protein [Herbaspirillum lusitanum]|uniref:hypothetical protein n=1 Tax=Herbaspirillum lusitanum TaxID=213312 RepID=UPI002238F7AC|nr:hypothetical protein [Herbaspirillum lusitanum]